MRLRLATTPKLKTTTVTKPRLAARMLEAAVKDVHEVVKRKQE